MPLIERVSCQEYFRITDIKERYIIVLFPQGFFYGKLLFFWLVNFVRAKLFAKCKIKCVYMLM